MLALSLTIAREGGVLRVRMLDETSGSRYRATATTVTDDLESLAGNVLAQWLSAAYPDRVRHASLEGAFGADPDRINADDLLSLESVELFAAQWLGVEVTRTHQSISGLLSGFVIWPAMAPGHRA